MGDGIEIKGSGPDYWKNTDLKTYRETTNTLGDSYEYFERFNKPMAERAKKKFGTPIHLLDIACGPADELTFFKDDPDVRLIATDISTDVLLRMTRPNVGQKVVLFDMDVNKPPILPDNSVECGILMNAMIYAPDKMLKTMFDALRPGGECTVNFMFQPPEIINSMRAHKEIQKEVGITLLEKDLKIAGQIEVFHVYVFDYSGALYKEGKPDNALQSTGQQIFFSSLSDVERLIGYTGFEIVERRAFPYARNSPIFLDTNVFVLRKPESLRKG